MWNNIIKGLPSVLGGAFFAAGIMGDSTAATIFGMILLVDWILECYWK
jgi:hypothetical protein